MKFPQDMRELDTEQREEAICFFTGLPLKELRRRQTISESDTASAYNRLRDAVDPAVRKRLERGLSNARIDTMLLSEAVGRKEFPETLPRRRRGAVMAIDMPDSPVES